MSEDQTYLIFYRYHGEDAEQEPEPWEVVDRPMSYEGAVAKVTYLSNKDNIRNVRMIEFHEVARYYGEAWASRETPARMHA